MVETIGKTLSRETPIEIAINPSCISQDSDPNQMTESTTLPVSSEENHAVPTALPEGIVVPPLPQVVAPVETGTGIVSPEAIVTSLSPIANTVGAQLKLLREQKNLSAQYIADKLNLNIKTISQLEADEYEKLPPTTFVRGYICSYAKLLDVDAAPLVESYKQSCNKPIPPLLPQFKEKPQANTGDPWFKVLTGVIIVALMLLMALWRPDNLLNKSSTPAPEANANNSNGQQGQSLALPPQAVSSTTPPPAVTPAPAPTTTATAPATTPPPEETNEANDTPTAAAAKQSEAAAKDPKIMLLHFKEDTWAEIIDARGKKVYSNVGKGGSDATVNGNPPFKVKVGTIGSMVTEYKGEKIDMTPQPNKPRKFTVGVALPSNKKPADEEEE
jgi:cytoskeleton protein RodZ